MRPVDTIEDTAPDDSERGLRTYHRDAEKAFLERFAEQHPQVLPERLHWEHAHPARLEDRAAFEAAFAERYQHPPEAGVIGFYDPVERQAHVRIEGNDDIVATIGHEHVHGLIEKSASGGLPTATVEGQTENYTRKAVGEEPEAGGMSAYQQEVERVRGIERIAGPEAMDKLFLEGDLHALDPQPEQSLAEWRAGR